MALEDDFDEFLLAVYCGDEMPGIVRENLQDAFMAGALYASDMDADDLHEELAEWAVIARKRVYGDPENN